MSIPYIDLGHKYRDLIAAHLNTTEYQVSFWFVFSNKIRQKFAITRIYPLQLVGILLLSNII